MRVSAPALLVQVLPNTIAPVLVASFASTPDPANRQRSPVTLH